jgi:hypothetical protein
MMNGIGALSGISGVRGMASSRFLTHLHIRDPHDQIGVLRGSCRLDLLAIVQNHHSWGRSDLEIYKPDEMDCVHKLATSQFSIPISISALVRGFNCTHDRVMSAFAQGFELGEMGGRHLGTAEDRE